LFRLTALVHLPIHLFDWIYVSGFFRIVTADLGYPLWPKLRIPVVVHNNPRYDAVTLIDR
jgi:hypothetical protein